MSSLTNKLEDTIDDVRSGKCPVKTADTVHKIGHTIAQNGFADAKLQDRGIRDAETKRIIQDHESLIS